MTDPHTVSLVGPTGVLVAEIQVDTEPIAVIVAESIEELLSANSNIGTIVWPGTIVLPPNAAPVTTGRALLTRLFPS